MTGAVVGTTELVAVQPAASSSSAGSYAAIAVPSAVGGGRAALSLTASTYWSSSAVAAARIRSAIPRLGTSGWRQYVPRHWYRYLRPQDYLALTYLCLTLPLCFVAPGTTGATPILFRLVMFPLYLLARPVSFMLPYPSTEPVGPISAGAAASNKTGRAVERDVLLGHDDGSAPTPGVYGDSACLDCCQRCCTKLLWVEADGCGCRRHAATGEYDGARDVPCCSAPRTGVLTFGCCGRGFTWYVWLCVYKLYALLVVVLPWFIYPVGYGETGKFITALHPSTLKDQCQNDPIVQGYDNDLFGGQVSITWRGDSTSTGHRLLAEYLQICYFGLYACVVGVPAALYWIAHHNRGKRAAAERDAVAATAAAAAVGARPGALVDVTADASLAPAPASAASQATPQPSPLTQSIPPRTPVGVAAGQVHTFGSPNPSTAGGTVAATPRGGVLDASATHTSRDTLVTVFGTPAPGAAAAAPALGGAGAADGTVHSGGALSVQVHPTAVVVSVDDSAAGLDATGAADHAAVAVAAAVDDAVDDSGQEDDLTYGYGSDGSALTVDEEHRFDIGLVTLLGVSMVCWVVYLFFPVAGPFWCFTRPKMDNVGFVFPYVLQYIQEAGAAHGTATPSSHCAVTVALWILCMVPRYGGKKLAFALAFIVPGLVVATVWCQYHYGFDAFVGVQMALLLAPAFIVLTTYATRRLRLKRLPSVNLVTPPQSAAAAR